MYNVVILNNLICLTVVLCLNKLIGKCFSVPALIYLINRFLINTRWNIFCSLFFKYFFDQLNGFYYHDKIILWNLLFIIKLDNHENLYGSIQKLGVSLMILIVACCRFDLIMIKLVIFDQYSLLWFTYDFLTSMMNHDD